MHTLNEFEFLMKSLPIEIGNKIFNYIMPSLGDHRKQMQKLVFEIHTPHCGKQRKRMKKLVIEIRRKYFSNWNNNLLRRDTIFWASEERRFEEYFENQKNDFTEKK